MKLAYMVTYKVRKNSVVCVVIVSKVKVTAAKNRLKMCWNFQIDSFPDFSLPLIQILCWFFMWRCMLMWYRTIYEFCSCWLFFEYCLLIGKNLDIVRFHSNLVHVLENCELSHISFIAIATMCEWILAADWSKFR